MTDSTKPAPQTWFLPCLSIFAVFTWTFLPTFRDLYGKWSTDPQYSHGTLVPLFSLFLLYQNRANLRRGQAWTWIGFMVLALAMASHAISAAISFLPLDGVAIVLSLLGIVLLFGGGTLLRGTWQPLLFLLFMIPLPYSVERMMGGELQRVATISSTFLLRCLGQPAIAEGNTILIGEVRLGVVEACSGLRMLVTFLAFSVAAVMLMERTWVVKALVLLSAVPIALFTNILRITGTGMAHIYLHDAESKTKVLDFLHDFNGWMMMPVGLTFLLLELWLFKHLILEPQPKTATAARTAPGFAGVRVQTSHAT